MLDATLRMDEIRFDDAALIAKGSSVHGCAMNVRPNSVTLIFAVLLLQGCTATAPQHAAPAYEPPAAAAAAQGDAAMHAQRPVATVGKGQIDVTGIWRGETSAECAMLIPDETRCGAVNDITLTLLQDGAKVNGLYKCAYGNMDCRNANETGKVVLGTVGTGLLQMRVMMPDGSDCIFNGRPMSDAIEGRYLCLQGGGVIERGIWRARRSY
jgi:hypothetical protein